MIWPFRKRYDFYKMLHDQSIASHATLKALLVFMDNPTREASDAVVRKEKEADAMRTKLAQALNASFVTPIDREDLYNLSRAIDDMADYAKTTVEEMALFEVAPTAYLREMTLALEGGSRLICEAVSWLSSRRNDRLETIRELLIKAKKTENFVERKYRQALRDLFLSSDVIQILKTREIYRHLSNAADRMDEAADIMGDVLMKIG